MLCIDRTDRLYSSTLHHAILTFTDPLLTLHHTIPTFNDLENKRAFENIEGKGENAGNQHFHRLPQCFLQLFQNKFQFFGLFFGMQMV